MSTAANDLRQLVEHIEGRLVLLPPAVSTDWDSFRRRRAGAENLGRSLGRDYSARIVFEGHAPSITMRGIRATSTMGFEGALNNWLTAARKKAAELDRAEAQS